MTQAPVNKILPLSVVDGPGSRAVIFLQGCNFQCAYCHNPETQKLCDSCGDCVEGCPAGALTLKLEKVVWDEEKCQSCDACIKTCVSHASPRVKMMSASETYEKVRQCLPFIRGITVSGGECTLYPDFLCELFSMAKKDGLTCLLDSNGSVDLSLHPKLVELCDGVMLDVKSWDSDVHRSLTGSDNFIVKKNLLYLADMGKLAEVRVVCLENETDADAVIEGVADAVGPGNTKKLLIKLIRFRRFGVRGRLEYVPSPGFEYIDALNARACLYGFRNVLIV